MTDQHSPLKSLREGHWFKLICGASFQHLPAIRNLALAYTLAGADCIDVAADPAVILAAQEGLDTAMQLANQAEALQYGSVPARPLLMVSLNDGDDPHFRKAEFVAEDCPADCPRPCEAICPAAAIDARGVIHDRCYGCGRCLPICPLEHITARSYVYAPETIAPLVFEAGIDALEIHTQPGHIEGFRRLWAAIAPRVHQLKLLAISCPDGENLIHYLQTLYEMIAPLPCPLIWQTDGRPMSGDIGMGTTKATVKLGQKVLQAGLPGYVQLAGGTNQHTVAKLRSLGLLSVPDPIRPAAIASTLDTSPTPTEPRYIAGIAYGSYARVLLKPVLEQLQLLEWPEKSNLETFALANCLHYPLPDAKTNQATHRGGHLETHHRLLQEAVNLASSLVSQLKPNHARGITDESNHCLTQPCPRSSLTNL